MRCKIFTYYQVIRLYYEDNCHNIFVANKYFDLFWNVFITKAVKVYHTITIGIQSYPMGSY